ncbi:hypothetical protein GGF46_004633 [Coemansia sp. RSA 552]|nr:hypothetical protein GGF46_004633 [Coemansia sp. RSA 552]
MASQQELTEKTALGLGFKDAGTQEFKAGNYEKALKEYNYALLHLRGLNDTPMSVGQSRDPENMKEEDITDLERDLSIINSNMAMCQMRLERYDRITRCANEALKFNPFNKKAKFKLAQGLVREGSILKAAKILDELAVDMPGDAAIAAERRNIQALERSAEAKQRKEFSGMFDRSKQAESSPEAGSS